MLQPGAYSYFIVAMPQCTPDHFPFKKCAVFHCVLEIPCCMCTFGGFTGNQSPLRIQLISYATSLATPMPVNFWKMKALPAWEHSHKACRKCYSIQCRFICLYLYPTLTKPLSKCHLHCVSTYLILVLGFIACEDQKGCSSVFCNIQNCNVNA